MSESDTRLEIEEDFPDEEVIEYEKELDEFKTSGKIDPSALHNPELEGEEVPQPTCAQRLQAEIVQSKEDLRDYAEEIQENVFSREGAKSIWHSLLTNWRAGATVALVNLPLSISLAVAASSSPVAGVVTAIWAGFIASIFGGCSYNIVGPTGALSGILAKNVAQFGKDGDPLAYLAILTGLICFFIFILKWERFVLLVPSSVTEGFTLGVALIIALNQLNFALGLPKPHVRHESFVDNMLENLLLVDQLDWASLVLFTVSLVALLVLITKFGKVPWAIILATLGIIGGALIANDVIPGKNIQTLETRFGDLDFALFSLPRFSSSFVSLDFFSAAFSIAFVAVLETLISAKIADGLTHTHFNQRREVFGLALANLVTGIFNGIPATAALARTALNIKSGATSRIAAVLNTIIVLLLSVALLRWFKYLPLPIVAAIIVVVAYRMCDFHHIVRFWRMDKGIFIMTLLVASICVLKDPTYGIVVGMVLSLLLFSDELSHVHSELVMKDEEGNVRYVSHREVKFRDKRRKRRHGSPHESDVSDTEHSTDVTSTDEHDYPLGDSTSELLHSTLEDSGEVPRIERHGPSIVVYRIAGQLTYINGMSHKERLQFFTDMDTIVISMRYLYFCDIDGLDYLGESLKELMHQGKKVLITGVNPSIAPLLNKRKWFRVKRANGEVFPTYGHALASLGFKQGHDSEHMSNIFLSNV
jgi:SulP family sulfate permease